MAKQISKATAVDSVAIVAFENLKASLKARILFDYMPTTERSKAIDVMRTLVDQARD